MQDIVISRGYYPSLTAEDAKLLLVKNDVLEHQLELAEAENRRLREIIESEHNARYRIYEMGFTRYFRASGLELVQKLIYAGIGVAFATVVTIAIWCYV